MRRVELGADIRVSESTGASLDRMAQRLRLIGDRTLMAELRKAMRESGSAAKTAVQASARELPATKYQRHLRDQTVAATKVSNRYGIGRSGVRIIVSKAAMGPKRANLPWLMDHGTWRHPVFGDREHWVTQRMPPGFFYRTIERELPEITRRMEAALDRIAHETEGLL